MDRFLAQAEEILEIAASADSCMETLISVDRQGAFRMMQPAGWSLPALAAELGSDAVFKLERRGTRVRVEGWNGSKRCLLEKNLEPQHHLTTPVISPYAVMLQLRSGATA